MERHQAPLVHFCATDAPAAAAHDLLARDRRVVAIEPPDAARDALNAVSDLGIERFDLMGTSSGASIALAVALAAPERVRSLVLVSPPAIGPHAGDAGQDAMRRLQVPVLVVAGTEDRLIAPETGRHYREVLPNCQLLFVYDAGHAVAADRPEAFTEAVSDFLERHEQYVVSRRSSVLFP